MYAPDVLTGRPKIARLAVLATAVVSVGAIGDSAFGQPPTDGVNSNRSSQPQEGFERSRGGPLAEFAKGAEVMRGWPQQLWKTPEGKLGLIVAMELMIAAMIASAVMRRRVFVSYRRRGTEADAARIADHLGHAFGKRSVFRDVDSTDGGANFVEVTKREILRSDAVVVVIGPDWSLSPGNEIDHVRNELALAVDAGVPIVPVLVRDANPPRAHELPPPLAKVSDLHAIHVRDDQFAASMTSLVKAVRKVPKHRRIVRALKRWKAARRKPA
jgi:hypothetical protein